MVHSLAGFNPGAGSAGGKDHGGELPFPVFPGKGLGHEKRRRDDVVTSAQRRILSQMSQSQNEGHQDWILRWGNNARLCFPNLFHLGQRQGTRINKEGQPGG